MLVLGSPALDGASITTSAAFGLAYGLLQHDMVDEFLLHYFAISAHAYTRGSWTTPEVANVVDRDERTVAFASAGEVLAPVYLKWMLCYEEPESRTLWLGKATPRDWLAPGEDALSAARLTTRYGRVSFNMSGSIEDEENTAGQRAYTVRASVAVPASFATAGPEGGLRVRLRVPLVYAGKLSGVTVGGSSWSAYDAAEETVDFSAAALTPALIRDGLPSIVATYSV